MSVVGYGYIPDGLYITSDTDYNTVMSLEWHSNDWRANDGGYKMCAWACNEEQKTLFFAKVKRMNSASPAYLAEIWEAPYDACEYNGGEPDCVTVDALQRIVESDEWERFRDIGTVGVYDSADKAAYAARVAVGC